MQKLSDNMPSSEFRTVLIADDDQHLLGLYNFFFRREGCEVILAKDGYEAIGKFSLANPDFVILDYEMPQIDGLTVATEILRKNATSTKKKTVVIMITANDKVRKEAEKVGVTLFFEKPISFKKVLNEMACVSRDK
jgi:chemosensory pili system protein ChpA (sensor histidine kinase/response regulator)